MTSGGGKEPTKVGELVDAYLEKSGVDKQVRRQEVLTAWDEVVGEAIAEVTRARSVSEGTLFVEVVSSAWLMELNMMKGKILRRLNRDREEASIDRLVFVMAEDRPDEDA